jgi:hypothetical protein
MTINGALSILESLEKDMKGYQFEAESCQRKINPSFALLAMNALQTYLRGDVLAAQTGFHTLAEELASRQRSASAAVPSSH